MVVLDTGRSAPHSKTNLDRAAEAHRAALAGLDEVKASNAERLRVAHERVQDSQAQLAQAIVSAYT